MENAIQNIDRLPLNQRLAYELHEANEHKIVLVIADGLGGLPLTKNGLTELESADRPNLNRLAQEGVCGRITHVAPGITPGSGPGHLAMFGYDPFFYRIGRGIVEALGSPYIPKRGEVLFRGNFVTRIPKGIVTSRKARGIVTDEAAPLVERLRTIQSSDADVQLIVEPLPDHRFLLVLRGPGLGDPSDLEEEILLLESHWEEYDFHFLHFKTTDREGEFGRFEEQVKAIEHLDRLLPRVLDLDPSVLIVTADHSTPATYQAHSWRPVPIVLAADTCCPDTCTSFGEREAQHGGIGDIHATDLMLIALGHAGRLRKFE